MKIVLLILLLALVGPAYAGYNEAISAIKNINSEEQRKALVSLFLKSGAELAVDGQLAALLKDNQKALELFRLAAEEETDGYLIIPSVKNWTPFTPHPELSGHFSLFRLLILEAKINRFSGNRVLAEKNLLAVAGFIYQLSAQKYEIFYSALTEQTCLDLSYPEFSNSLRDATLAAQGGRSAGVYVKQLSARLEKIYKNQDFMKAALQENCQRIKNLTRETVTKFVEKLPFWQRIIFKRVSDKEYFEMVYRHIDLWEDIRLNVDSNSFRLNSPEIGESFHNQQQFKIKERIEQVKKNSAEFPKYHKWATIKDTFSNGPIVKGMIAEMVALYQLSVEPPPYYKMVARYHVFFSELNILRAAIAVKMYRSANKKLPESLDLLVPAYLDAVPLDYFNKKTTANQFKYFKKGKKFVVYGFGPDEIDGKGAVPLNTSADLGDPKMSAGDIVFSD